MPRGSDVTGQAGLRFESGIYDVLNIPTQIKARGKVGGDAVAAAIGGSGPIATWNRSFPTCWIKCAAASS